MGRRACSSKQGVNRGAWSADEDRILYEYVPTHGEGKWGVLSRRAGLNHCGKSCQLRRLNYLQRGIKRGNFTEDEEDLIIRLHKLLGNRWSLIAGRLPGRTDNEIKNYRNTKLRKKVAAHNNEFQEKKTPSTAQQVIQTKAKKFTKTLLLPQQVQITKENNTKRAEEGATQPSLEDQESSNYFMDLDGGESLESNVQNSNYLKSFDEGMLENGDKSIGTWSSSGHPSPFKEDTFESWGITQQLALDVLGSSDENSQENGGSIGGDFGHNLWLHLDQENSENWWMGDYFQINGGPELKV